MHISPVTIKDKKGREIILRSASEHDAGDLLRYPKITAAESSRLPYIRNTAAWESAEQC